MTATKFNRLKKLIDNMIDYQSKGSSSTHETLKSTFVTIID